MKRRGFIAPNDAVTRQHALGDGAELLVRCWDCFERMPPAKRDDWLADGNPGENDRAGQPVKRFLQPGPHRAFPSRLQSKIYLLPLGDCSHAPPLPLLCDLLKRWFSGLEVMPLAGKAPSSKEVKALPRNEEGCGYGPQIECPSAHALVYSKKPRDAFAVVAYTMEDICDTAKGFQFLFGQAQLDKSVGIFSFARYAEDEPSPSRFLRRCGMVLCHETCHLFGIKHCVYAKCVMNGSNHLAESESRPFALCPVDMRKLQATLDASRLDSVPLDVIARERLLLEWFDANGLDDDAQFTRHMLATISSELSTSAAETTKAAKLVEEAAAKANVEPLLEKVRQIKLASPAAVPPASVARKNVQARGMQQKASEGR